MSNYTVAFSLTVFSNLHVSLAISDQPYGVKDPSVSILSPQEGLGPSTQIGCTWASSLILGVAMCCHIKIPSNFAGLDLVPCNEYGNECGIGWREEVNTPPGWLYFYLRPLYIGLKNLRLPWNSKKNSSGAFGAAPFAYSSKFIEGSWGLR